MPSLASMPTMVPVKPLTATGSNPPGPPPISNRPKTPQPGSNRRTLSGQPEDGVGYATESKNSGPVPNPVPAATLLKSRAPRADLMTGSNWHIWAIVCGCCFMVTTAYGSLIWWAMSRTVEPELS